VNPSRNAGDLEHATGPPHGHMRIDECSESGQVHQGHTAEICYNVRGTVATLPMHCGLEHPDRLRPSDRAMNIQNSRIAESPLRDSHGLCSLRLSLVNNVYF